jgi:hypothetical protein
LTAHQFFLDKFDEIIDSLSFWGGNTKPRVGIKLSILDCENIVELIKTPINRNRKRENFVIMKLNLEIGLSTQFA